MVVEENLASSVCLFRANGERSRRVPWPESCSNLRLLFATYLNPGASRPLLPILPRYGAQPCHIRPEGKDYVDISLFREPPASASRASCRIGSVFVPLKLG